jgi:hypothetical protein
LKISGMALFRIFYLYYMLIFKKSQNKNRIEGLPFCLFLAI